MHLLQIVHLLAQLLEKGGLLRLSADRIQQMLALRARIHFDIS